MAEVKSTLEIALERAAALGGRDTDEEQRQEAGKTGQVAARKILSGDAAPKDINSLFSNLAEEYRMDAVREAARLLMEPLPRQRDLALESLSFMLPAEGEQRDRLLRLEQVLNELHQATLDLSRELADEMKRDLEAKGFSGSAIRVNPETHPRFGQRAQDVLAPKLVELEQTGNSLLLSLD